MNIKFRPDLNSDRTHGTLVTLIAAVAMALPGCDTDAPAFDHDKMFRNGGANGGPRLNTDVDGHDLLFRSFDGDVIDGGECLEASCRFITQLNGVDSAQAIVDAQGVTVNGEQLASITVMDQDGETTQINMSSEPRVVVDWVEFMFPGLCEVFAADNSGNLEDGYVLFLEGASFTSTLAMVEDGSTMAICEGTALHKAAIESGWYDGAPDAAEMTRYSRIYAAHYLLGDKAYTSPGKEIYLVPPGYFLPPEESPDGSRWELEAFWNSSGVATCLETPRDPKTMDPALHALLANGCPHPESRGPGDYLTYAKVNWPSLFSRTADAAISGHNSEYLTDVSPDDCAKACTHASRRDWCVSFDYYKESHACDLSSKRADDVGGLKTNYPGNPLDHYSLDSLRMFNHTADAAISGHNAEHLTDVSPDKCAEACTHASRRDWCVSFDYYKDSNACDLSSKRADDVGGLKTSYQGNPFDHYSLDSLRMFNRTATVGIVGHDIEHLTDVSPDDCAEACTHVSRRDWCVSFDYYKDLNTCDLSSKRAGDVGGLKTDYQEESLSDHYSLTP